MAVIRRTADKRGGSKPPPYEGKMLFAMFAQTKKGSLV